MLKRSSGIVVVVGLGLALAILFAGTALAWPDLGPDDWGKYGITEDQIKAVSEGYPDGTWKPYDAVSRKQSAKMAVEAYKIALVSPDTPTYTDVSKTDPYYGYIETVTAAGLTNGIGGGLFAPDAATTREQAVAMISRWVAERNGYDLEEMYTQGNIDTLLGRFSDGDQVSPGVQAEMAYAVDFGIVMGKKGALMPAGTLARIQYAATLIRSMGQTGDARSSYLGNFAGVIGTEAEFAMNEAKNFSLSDPFDPKDEPVLSKIVKQKTDGYGVSYYLEKDLMLTDLFAEYDMTNLWVYIIYKKPAVLQAYFDLKAEEAALKAGGNYENETEKRASIAFRFGKILGYSDAYLKAKLNMD